MQPEEIDIALDELENRLDRLRGLYEQYFLGIEKIEPSVARKDVDRRFWILRRTQIRNTARRFRMQVLIQRYNTFQQYWARICREIENGTYTRHLIKAHKRLGEEPKTWAAKKRLGFFRRRGGDDSDAAGDEPRGDDGDLGALLDGNVDLAHEAVRAAEEAAANVRTHQVVPRAELESLGPLDLDFDEGPAAARRVEAPAPRTTSPATEPVKAVARPLGDKPRLPTRSVQKPPAAPGVPGPAGPPPTKTAEPRMATAFASPAPGVTDERVKQLHAELVATKRKLNQGEGVSMDALARSLRETEQKLRAQHVGRSVDFQIVVKDGKPVVKPVVRK